MKRFTYGLAGLAAVVVGLILLGPRTASAQDATPKTSKAKTEATPASIDESKKPEKKLSLNNVTPVTTEETARGAAKETPDAASKTKDDKSTDTGIDSVLEFHAASQDEHAPPQSDARVSTKKPKKNIHGEAYGGIDSRGPGNHQAGGAAGTTSKSGKTSVFVQGEQTRSAQPPH